MKIRKRYLTGALLIVVCLLGAALSHAHAQSGEGYDLTWNTLESGGPVEASGGGYSLYGNIGQPDAGAALNAGGYTLTGGFWSGILANFIYLPLTIRP